MNNLETVFNGVRIGFALCGSFCTFEKAFSQIQKLSSVGAKITPIMSHNASTIDTRFGLAHEHKEKLKDICGCEVIDTIEKAEPIGPGRMFDLLIIAPCTGNTLAKLANGITDTAVVL